MTDADNPSGVQTKEVSLYNKDGVPYDDTNPVTVQQILVDDICNAPVVIQWEHHLLHKGIMFHAFEEQLSLDTSTVQYVIVVGAKEAHMLLPVEVFNGNVMMRVYRDAEYTGGATLDAHNRHGDFPLEPTTSIKTGVASSNGTHINSMFAGSSKGSDEQRGLAEWDMEANSIYRVDLIGLQNGVQAIMQFAWYEPCGT